MNARMAPTGRSFEIIGTTAAGETTRAVVTEVGAGLRLFEVGGVACTESFPEDARPPKGAGLVLAPWPNRVAGGRWTWRGTPQQLALTEPGPGNAIHGLLRYTLWHPVAEEPSAVTLRAVAPPQPGWPQPVQVDVRYAVGADGLQVTGTATNLGDDDVPFGLGAHPYLRVGDVPTDDCTLTLAARAELPLRDQLPAGPPRPLGAPLQVALREVTLDAAYTDCALADGRVRHRLAAPDGRGVELWADPAFGWVQVFTPSDFPGRGRAVAVEPMTCPPDALNSGTDLIVLAPGETWTGSWGLRPF